MRPVTKAFAAELMKLSAEKPESLGDVVGAEALGPIASAVKGWKRRGFGGAARAGLAYAAGGGAGALGGALVAKGVRHLLGRDPGIGPVRASTTLPALGALILGLKAEHLANR